MLRKISPKLKFCICRLHHTGRAKNKELICWSFGTTGRLCDFTIMNIKWKEVLILDKFDWGVRYVIIFLYVQFLIRLAAVSYRGEKVRTVVCPAVRSVNKSCDTRNCVQNGAEYTICVLFTTRLFYKALGIILCTLICQIRRTYNGLDDDHCDVTGHRKISALGTASAMVTTHDNAPMMW